MTRPRRKPVFAPGILPHGGRGSSAGDPVAGQIEDISLEPHPPAPALELTEEEDRVLSNMITRCELLLESARNLVFCDLSATYQTEDRGLDLHIRINIRSARRTQ